MSKCAELRFLLALGLLGCGSAGGHHTPATDGQAGVDGLVALAPDASTDGAAGGDPGAAMDAPRSVDGGSSDRSEPDDCDRYAAKLCGRFADCLAAYLVGVYGSAEVCAQRTALRCRNQTALPGTGATPMAIAACIEALGTAGCADLFGDTVPACQFVGTLSKGAPCGAGAQCDSGFCRTPETAFCGRCDVRGGEGATCDSDAACPVPLQCSEAGRCAPAALEGDLCNESRSCKKGAQLYCGADNACHRRSVAGKSCNRTGAGSPQPCEWGSVCRPTANGVCRPIRWAGPGEPCGLPMIGTTVVLCAGSGSCVDGVCQPPGRDGDSCTPSPLGDSGGCLPPALCLEGHCQLPDPGSCK